MTDFSATFANRFESTLAEQNQPATDIVNARLERIEELERVRQERLATHNSSNSNNNDAASRLQRRERIIRQTTQNRSMERRSFASNIQRTPVVRSQTLETHAPINEENMSFREMFESTRQNLFGPRVSASSENLSSFHRSASDTRLMRAPVVVPPESDSGSSTPRSTSRPRWDLASGLAEAFSSVRSSLIRPETSLSSSDVSRSPATVRETRNTSTNMQRFMMSNSNDSPLSRSASVRESRRENRLRRRTIEGVDSNVTRALERERTERVPNPNRSSSVTRTQSFNRTQAARSQLRQTLSQESDTTSEVQTVVETASESQSSSSSYSSYTPYRRTVDLFPDDSVPVLGLEEEKVKFIDAEGHCHWLSKHHQLLRMIKNTKNVPEIKKVKIQSTDPSDSEGFIATMNADVDSRYKKLRQLVYIARKQEEILSADNDADYEHRMSLLELYERGDFLDEKQEENKEDIDEKYKSFSLYTHPRSPPNLEEYLSTRVVIPLYEGIEIQKEESEKKEPEVIVVPRHFVEYQLSASRIAGMNFKSTTTNSANGGASIVSQRIAQARQHSMAVSQSLNGQSTSFQSSEQSAFSQEVREEFDNSDSADNVEENSEVNLVMERIHMMQAASGQEGDASHLDYDEMLMIQQALEDNPSPPDTPEPMSPYEQYFVEDPHEEYTISESPQTTVPSLLPRMNSAPFDIGSSRPPTGRASTSTQQVNRSEARSVMRSFSSDGNQSTERSSSRLSQSMSSVTNNNNSILAKSEVFSESSSTSQTVTNSGNVPSCSPDSNLNNQGQESSNLAEPLQTRPYPNRVSMSPRLQRISSSGSDTMLPLPTMDFSPLSKTPSPQRFNFNESNTSETINEVNNTNSDTITDVNQTNRQTNETDVINSDLHTELSIEIPESTDSLHPLRSNSSSTQEETQGQRSTMSPAVKSRTPSVASNDAVSPAGSDVVTTVFEEFVQTIPRDLLNSWSSSQDER